jgi:hypothetical protein
VNLRRVLGLLGAMSFISPVVQAGCSIQQIAELPVTMHGLSPLVAIKINGVDTNLIADSGAFWSSLSPGRAAELKLRLEPAPSWLTVYGVGGHVDLRDTCERLWSGRRDDPQ